MQLIFKYVLFLLVLCIYILHDIKLVSYHKTQSLSLGKLKT